MHRELITTTGELDALLGALEGKYRQERGAYFYRGHAHQNYLLQPSAFRPAKIEQMNTRFRSDHNIYTLAYGEKARVVVTKNFDNNSDYAAWFMRTDSYRRIVEIIDFLRKYNFCLSDGVEEHESLYDSKSVEHKLYRPSVHWQSEDEFYTALLNA